MDYMYIEKCMPKLNKYLKKITPISVLFLTIFLYIFITATALLDKNHFLYNLEPYPDGILYVGSAQNFAQGQGLKLQYNNYTIPLWVPPLYPLYLSIFFVFTQATSMFYIANIVLGTVCIYLLYTIVEKVTKSKWLGVLGSALYIAHGYIVWLPSVPMTENMSLMFFLLGLFTLFSKETKYRLTLFIISILGLIFTRYSVLPTALVLAALFLHQNYWNNIDKKEKVTLCLGVTLSLISILFLRFEQIADLLTNTFKGSVFYNVTFASNNLIQYTKSLLGFNAPFLWLQYPFTSAFLALSMLFYSIYELCNKNKIAEKITVLKLLALFISQYILLLIFYTVDNRYAIFSLPLIVLLVSLAAHVIYSKKSVYGLVFTVLCFTSIIFSQANFYKYLLTANLLGRTTAWQYESIRQIDSYFKNNNSNGVTLITALPPFLVTSYKDDFISLLPLSHSQEFLQKKQYVWGDTINYNNLTQEYAARIRAGEKVYITNAYITHQQQVIKDFENIKTVFNLTLVSSGCLDACNLYHLEIKQ